MVVSSFTVFLAFFAQLGHSLFDRWLNDDGHAVGDLARPMTWLVQEFRYVMDKPQASDQFQII